MHKKILFSSITLFILIAIASIGAFFAAEHLLHKQKVQPPKPVDFFMTNVSYLNLNNAGKMQSNLTAKQITHSPNEDAYLLQSPHLIMIDKDNKTWDVSANSGKSLHGNDIIYLWDNVNIRQFDPVTQKNKLNVITTKATIYPRKKLGETDQPLEIQENNSTIHAVGAKVDFNKSTVKLLSKVMGKYKE
jgi:LPS export ABC transporter protein LptC